MQVTKAHLDFFMQRKYPAPKFADRVLGGVREPVSIDRLINWNTGTPSGKGNQYGSAFVESTLSILRSCRSRARTDGREWNALMTLSTLGNSSVDKRRLHNARKWMSRIERNRAAARVDS